MAIPGEVQNFHGRHGEDVTAEIIGRRFWYLKRSVDIEGADFLVQIRANSFEELDSKKIDISVLGIVQSKFVQIGSTVYINKKYCVDNNGNPINQFFLMCHTQDEEERTHTYFFTSEEIIARLKYCNEKDAYAFYLGVTDVYSDKKDLSPKKILDAIQFGIQSVKKDKNELYVKKVLFYSIEASRNYGGRYFYLLRKVEGVSVCVTENASNGTKNLLEPRRDIFSNFGGFCWGYSGTGPRFLASSMLSHIMDGLIPTEDEIDIIVGWLIEFLNPEENWDIPPEIILAILAGIPIPLHEMLSFCLPSKSYEERNRKLGKKILLEKLDNCCKELAMHNPLRNIESNYFECSKNISE